MLRAAWRALSSVRTQAVTQAPVSGLLGRGSARLPSDQWGLQPQSLLQAARGYTIQKPVQPKQDDDPPPSTLLKDYQNIPGIEKVDDVVRRLLSLEMANQKEKLKIKQEQLMNKIVANPEDTSSLEARSWSEGSWGVGMQRSLLTVVALTIKIRNYEEHMQKHRKDKAHKRYLLMSIDQRKKMLKNLRKTNYDVFEKTCRELGIEYTFPPLYYRTAHRRFVAKRALCLRVFQEAQKLKKQKRILKAAAMATPKQDDQGNPENPSKACTEALKGNQ
ncbi:28S ribosomal protein S15, mitochondrial isoform X1 [Sciurus carolinensis]|uniref:28S ribosomal protein S15, mitochondrial isoform X1 n=1 Tax=Sciurus carolinensis TaxID=30640 RepID=UPI001FB50F4B|nr:28S ribosomal protein S15, mitochondrial isoform X1 [Sciurus carolinensis]